jgi:hypothetical protein
MNTAEQLAVLTERLNNHIDQTEAHMKEDREERQIAGAERHEMLAGLKELRRTVVEIKPVTDMVVGVKAKLVGASILLGFLGTVIIGGLALWKEHLSAFFVGGN